MIELTAQQQASEDLHLELVRIKAENEKLRKCVEFYASGDHITNDISEVRKTAKLLYWDIISIGRMGGKLARETLKEIEQ